MKNNTLLLSLLLCVVFFPKQSVSQTELLTNGNFDDETSNAWVFGENTARSTQANTAPFSAVINPFQYADASASMYQKITFPKDVTLAVIKLKYKVRTIASNLEESDIMALLIMDLDDQDNYVKCDRFTNQTIAPSFTETYDSLSGFDISQVSKMTSPAFVFLADLGTFGGTAFFVDDITFQVAQGTPITNFSATVKPDILTNQLLNFVDLSKGAPTEYHWKFYDGSVGQGYQESFEQYPTGIAYNNKGTFDVSLTTTNSLGSDTKVKQNYVVVSEENPTGISTVSNSTLWLSTYPNPVKDILTLEFKENLLNQRKNIRIVNQIGETVATETVEQGIVAKQYNFSDFPTGFYMVLITTTDGRLLCQKVLKQ